ncbi:MAG: hypothetical protein HYT79_02320 [Elusimicrobia bacterium]|nr:hypothetical protein [Elusimicrobiota bacterium]
MTKQAWRNTGQFIMMCLIIMVSALALPCHATEEPRFFNCSEQEKTRLKQAIKGADKIAKGCLIRKGLNRSLGEAIRERIAGAALTFACGEEGVWGQTFASENSAAIRVGTVPKPDYISERADDYEYLVFHELSHAADHEDRGILSTYLHNEHRTADVIYACEEACRYQITMPRLISRILETEIDSQNMGGPSSIEPDSGWPCRDTQDCQTVQKLARICRDGQPFQATVMRTNLRKLELKACIFDRLAWQDCQDLSCLDQNVKIYEKLTKVFDAMQEGSADTLMTDPEERTIYEFMVGPQGDLLADCDLDLQFFYEDDLGWTSWYPNE